MKYICKRLSEGVFAIWGRGCGRPSQSARTMSKPRPISARPARDSSMLEPATERATAMTVACARDCLHHVTECARGVLEVCSQGQGHIVAARRCVTYTLSCACVRFHVYGNLDDKVTWWECEENLWQDYLPSAVSSKRWLLPWSVRYHGWLCEWLMFSSVLLAFAPLMIDKLGRLCKGYLCVHFKGRFPHLLIRYKLLQRTFHHLLGACSR